MSTPHRTGIAQQIAVVPSSLHLRIGIHFKEYFLFQNYPGIRAREHASQPLPLTVAVPDYHKLLFSQASFPLSQKGTR